MTKRLQTFGEGGGAVWAPGCDSRVPTAHAQEVLHFVNGPVSS
ncbi:unnamed protein product, partial [Staurois parvus]